MQKVNLKESKVHEKVQEQKRKGRNDINYNLKKAYGFLKCL